MTQRASFLKIVALVIAFSISGAATAEAQSISVVIRKNINDMTERELAAYRDAIAYMTNLDARLLNPSQRNTTWARRSFKFWANMHGHWDSNANDVCAHSDPKPEESVNAANDPINRGLQNTIEWNHENTAESQTWCSCVHKRDDGITTNISNFLTWHRMYVFFFERVVKWAAIQVANQRGYSLSRNPEYANLALPYWDVTLDGGRMPAAFRAPRYRHPIEDAAGVTRPNPLYRAERSTQANAGTQVISPASARGTFNTLAIDVTDCDDGSCDNANELFREFSNTLEQNPHVAVHCNVSMFRSCANGLMGRNETAANDPVFWSHHANIDRIYECWLKQHGGRAFGGSYPTSPALINQSFSFINKNGNVITQTVASALRTGDPVAGTGQLIYSYNDPNSSSNCNIPANISTWTFAGLASPGEGAPVNFSADMSSMLTFAYQSLIPSREQENNNLSRPASINFEALMENNMCTSNQILINDASSFSAAKLSNSVVIPKAPAQKGRKTKLIITDVIPDPSGRIFEIVMKKADGSRKVVIGTIGFFGDGITTQKYNITEYLPQLGLKAGDKALIEFVPEGGDGKPVAMRFKSIEIK